MEKYLKKILVNNDLSSRKKVIEFIKENPENLSIDDLSKIAEFTNTKRSKIAAYYTDSKTLEKIQEYMPQIDKSVIRILEPSAGIGNFLKIIINKYKNAKKLIIDLNDIDSESIEIIKLLNKYRDIPDNVEINYFNQDYLTFDFKKRYDLIIGNPPFLKLSKKQGLNKYSNIFNDNTTKNLAGFFLEKSINISDNVILILPKYFLHNNDFSYVRDVVNNFNINTIIDFGEKGFEGVLIETIALFINTLKKPGETLAYSVTKNLFNKQNQKNMTDRQFPSWIIYRNEFFDKIVSEMNFNIFKPFRDRQITNKLLKKKGDIRVLKSRNINRAGTKIENIENYDSFIDEIDLKNISVYKYLNRDDVYLCPNMTYYPRMIRKPRGVVVNGSIAILENISNFSITDEDLKFFSSTTFEEFYRIARNYSTRSLNIDVNSVIFFGLLKK
ncbi:MAG: class I SAM-dependent methyltransferase [Methanosphaera sp.]|uniref:class I SAM-dependent methyltransferase n=1 Tax=Methanosphaera sp. TaxID=2666342 RepID=UPI0026237C1D|nr:class I SAM-dependent methyltransferase [Methanosphaera sp.]MDD6534198.1 class I SAM-dependent methyltransferase [Methanosphaera sp.]